MADSDEPMSVCSNDRSARAALSIMPQWQWGYYDPDGERVSDSMSLGKVVSRLAMEGQAAPKQDILKLLCSDVLRARGDYQWRKFSDGEYYELSGSAADVPSARWQVLFDLIDVSEKRLGKLDEPQPKIVLLMLGNGEWPAFNWDHYQGEFLTLQTSGYASSFTPEYFEETYSVTLAPIAQKRPAVPVLVSNTVKGMNGGKLPNPRIRDSATHIAVTMGKGERDGPVGWWQPDWTPQMAALAYSAILAAFQYRVAQSFGRA